MSDNPHSSHSETQRDHNSKHKAEHGTLKSYVIGFILSLIFTFIPYYLVTDNIIEGTSLLVTIIVFAVVQMIIQVTFFLHLGRGPKPNWNFFFFISTIGIILVVVGGSIVIINNLHYNMSPSDQVKKIVNDENIYQIGGQETGACRNTLTNHKITINAGKISPLHVNAKLCDTMTFIVLDDIAREIAFGPHPNHDVYAGETELLVRKGRNKTITLSQLGTYQFHNHVDTNATGHFTVAP